MIPEIRGGRGVPTNLEKSGAQNEQRPLKSVKETEPELRETGLVLRTFAAHQRS